MHTKDDAAEGWVNIPCEYLFPDDTTMMTIVDPKSPYEIRGEDRKDMLYLEENAIEAVIFPRRPKWYTKKTSNGTLMSTVGFQALEEDDARKLYDLGVQVICYPMEVWQEDMWPIIVPGKSKFVGRDR